MRCSTRWRSITNCCRCSDCGTWPEVSRFPPLSPPSLRGSADSAGRSIVERPGRRCPGREPVFGVLAFVRSRIRSSPARLHPPPKDGKSHQPVPALPVNLSFGFVTCSARRPLETMPVLPPARTGDSTPPGSPTKPGPLRGTSSTSSAPTNSGSSKATSGGQRSPLHRVPGELGARCSTSPVQRTYRLRVLGAPPPAPLEIASSLSRKRPRPLVRDPDGQPGPSLMNRSPAISRPESSLRAPLAATAHPPAVFARPATRFSPARSCSLAPELNVCADGYEWSVRHRRINGEIPLRTCCSTAQWW